MRKGKGFFFLGLVLLLSFAFLQAQINRQTGAVRGIIKDTDGNPLPGVNLTLAGPSMMGKATDVSRGDGTFRFPAIPPGTYTLTCELQGFKTLNLTDIVVRVGLTVTLDIKMEITAVKEQVTVVAKSPEIDVQKPKITSYITSQQLSTLPLNRSLANVLNIVPGTTGTFSGYGGNIHGLNWNGVAYEVDGVNANCPTTGTPFGLPQFDAVEEIEVVTGALPANSSVSGGAFVNIVTKAGGNTFHGTFQSYYTNKNLNQVLFSDEELKAMNVGKPSFSIYSTDNSGVLGGPIIKDKLWFFADAAYTKSNRWSAFIPTTILGTYYDQYKVPSSIFNGNIKLTTEFSKKLRFYTYFSLRATDGMYGGTATKEVKSVEFWTKPKQYVSTANLTWIPTSNSFIDFRINLNHLDYPIQAPPESNVISYRDGYTGYTWGGIFSWESFMTRHTSQASVRMTHFQDNFLGGDHEIGAGAEFQFGWDRYAYARKQPLDWWYWNGNPYYWRGYYGVDTTTPRGDGRFWITNCGGNRNDSYKDLFEYRIGAYFQDNWTIKRLLTLNLGLRLDHYYGWGGKGKTTGTLTTLSDLPYAIGQTLEPQLGFNPFGPFSTPPIYDVVNFTSISPRIGLSYDLFGNGKTSLKAFFGHYSEQLPVMFFSSVSPSVMARYEFWWWDLNGNGIPDLPPIDHYEPPNNDLSAFVHPDVNYLKNLVDKNLTATVNNEVVFGIEHQLFKDFSVKLDYIYKKKTKMNGSAHYDPVTQEYWSELEKEIEAEHPEWFVPFNAIIPAMPQYGIPETHTTLYFVKKDSPYQAMWNRGYDRTRNDPYTYVKYSGAELSFNKRFTHGWSLAGSVVYSRTISGTRYVPGPLTDLRYYYYRQRDGSDVPLQLKLYGTFNLPYGFVTSFFLRYQMGSPWARSISIQPPVSWFGATNTISGSGSVQFEPSGTKRTQDYTNVDFHLEKKFKLPYGTIGAFVDIYNLLGNRYIYYGLNPGGTWYPSGEETTQGTYKVSYDYGRVTSFSGLRTFMFSVRYEF